MKQFTRFSIRPKGKTEYASIGEIEGFVPNLEHNSPIKIRCVYYWVRFVETHITEAGDIIQHVILKEKP